MAQIYLQVNNETQPNFINVKPQLGSFENYNSYPKDKFFILDENVFRECVSRDDGKFFHGILRITEFYFFEKNGDNYILTRYDYSKMHIEERDFFKKTLKNGNILLSRDFYEEFNMSEEDLYNKGISNISLDCMKRVKKILNAEVVAFKNILEYCSKQAELIRLAAQLITSMEVADINFLVDVEIITDNLSKIVTPLEMGNIELPDLDDAIELDDEVEFDLGINFEDDENDENDNLNIEIFNEDNEDSNKNNDNSSVLYDYLNFDFDTPF